MTTIKPLILFFKKYSLIFKILISAVLLIWVFSNVQWRELINIIPDLKISWLFLLLAVLFVNLLAGSYKWFNFLRFADLHYTFQKILKISGISLFYNQVLPGRIGGDVVKLFHLINKNNDKTTNYRAGISIYIDRFSNIIGLLFLSYISASLSFQFHREYIPYILAFSIISAVVLLLTFWGPSLIIHLIPSSWIKAKNVAIKLKESRKFINNFKKALFFFVSGIFVQFIAILAQYFTGMALGIELGLDYYLFFVPLVFIITLLPITFGGFGLREMSYVFFLQQSGVPAEKAIMLSLITYVGVVLISLPFVFMTSKKPTNTETNND